MSLVMYQVIRRPISSNGKVYRGTGYGDFITILTNPDALKVNGVFPTVPTDLGSTASGSETVKFLPVGTTAPRFTGGGSSAQPAKSHVEEVSGEPWLVHSTHFSIESATGSAAPLAASIGSENVRIVKVITGSFEFKLK